MITVRAERRVISEQLYSGEARQCFEPSAAVTVRERGVAVADGHAAPDDELHDLVALTEIIPLQRQGTNRESVAIVVGRQDVGLLKSEIEVDEGWRVIVIRDFEAEQSPPIDIPPTLDGHHRDRATLAPRIDHTPHDRLLDVPLTPGRHEFDLAEVQDVEASAVLKLALEILVVIEEDLEELRHLLAVGIENVSHPHTSIHRVGRVDDRHRRLTDRIRRRRIKLADADVERRQEAVVDARFGERHLGLEAKHEHAVTLALPRPWSKPARSRGSNQPAVRASVQAEKQRPVAFLDENRGKRLCHGFATSYGIWFLSAGTSGTSATGNSATSLQGVSGANVF
ncbi:MAG: hypothetical protein ACKV2T_31945 [Kofleriaceae bacterium]